MRLETQLAIIQQATAMAPAKIDWQIQNNFAVMGGKAVVRASLEAFRTVPYLAQVASKLLAFGTFTIADDQLSMSQDEGSRFASLYQSLRAQAAIALSVLKTTTKEQSPYTVAVRLPTFDSFGQLEQLVHTFGLIFNKTVGCSPQKEEIKVEIVGFDVGSNYLLVCLGAEVGVHVIGQLTQAVHYIQQQIANAIALRQNSRIGKAKADMAAKAAEVFAWIADDLYQEQAEAFVQNDLGGVKPGEDKVQRMVKVMRDLYDMVDKGAEIRPMALAPSNVQLEFPDASKPLQGLKPKELGPSETEKKTETEE